MINKRDLANDLTEFLALKQWQDENDIPDNKYIDQDDVPELAKMEYRNNPVFYRKVNMSLAIIMQTIDKHVEIKGVEADAARYRHLRDSWVRRCGMSNNSKKRLEWYLPHVYHGGNAIPAQLDNSIDEEIRCKERSSA